MKNTEQLNIIIPAAGIGKRMKSYGPKCLVNLQNYKSILHHQLKTIQSIYPHSKIFIVAGFEKLKIYEFVKKWDNSEHILGSPKVEVLENNEYDTTPYNQSINIGMSKCKVDSALIVMGDILFNKHTLNKLRFDKSFVIYNSDSQIKSKEVGLQVIDGYASYFGYGLQKKWAQIVYLRGNEFRLFRCLSKSNLFTFEIFNKIIDAGGKLKAIEPSFMRVFEVDSVRDIKELKKGVNI